MKIAEVSKKYEVSSDTLRYYERVGLLREAAPGGKRRYRGSLLLTDAGREQAEAMSGIVSSKLAEVSAELRADEVETFYKVFHKIADKLENI